MGSKSQEKVVGKVMSVEGSVLKMRAGRRLRVISVTSGKGGVGKSSIVLNLGLTLAKEGRRVLILDADVGLANIDVMLGVRPDRNISQVLKGEARLADVIIPGPFGIRLMPGGSGFSEFSALGQSEKLIFLAEVEQLGEDIDYVLIDTSPGIHSNVRFFNSCASEIIVVANSEPTSITDSYALIKVLNFSQRMKRFSLLINNVATEKEAKGVYRKLAGTAERFLNISLSYLGFLPSDPGVGASIREQNPLCNRDRVTPYSAKMKNLCLRIDNLEPQTGLNGNLQFFFRRMLEDEDRLSNGAHSAII